MIGPLLIVASFLSVLRQTERMHFDHELPVLVILRGLLLLIARSKHVPVPKWFFEVPVNK